MNFQCHNFQFKTFQPLLTDLFYWLSRNWVKLVMVLAIASWLAVLSFPDSRVKIVYCNAGQGDETLIQRGFTQILIDGSRPGRALDCLRKHVPFFDRQIEMVVVSHPQLDHFGGLTDVVKRYKVVSFVYNGLRSDSREWERKTVVSPFYESTWFHRGLRGRLNGYRLLDSGQCWHLVGKGCLSIFALRVRCRE